MKRTRTTGLVARPPEELTRGTVVGRYVLLQELGAGGMGVVYAAYDPELDRKVAVKLLHAGVSTTRDNDGHKRLLREAQAMAQLSHPSVITVHDVGEHGGRVYVAMEFVEGETLGSWLKQERSWSEVLAVFVSAARGLAAAHEKGLVHRDFKPDNVMVGTDGRVRVMDFGLARPIERSGHPERSSDELVAESKDTKVRPSTDALGSDLTAQGSVVGTPAYMAPEQHLGLDTDARTDQFSYCVALWEGLFGERPFSGETVAALAFSVTQGNLREIPSGTEAPRWLRAIVTRGLSADPGTRFASMAALLEAAARGAAKRRRRLGLAAVFGVALLGLGAWGAWALERERRRTGCHTDADGIATVWNDETSAQLREALVGTGVSYAESTFAHAVPFVDAYVAAWRDHYAGLCVASEADGTRPDALWEASRQCLAERRGALATLLEVLREDADAIAVQQTVRAVAGLARLEPCADDAWLARHPARAGGTDESTGELRSMLWRARALEAAGQYQDGLALAKDIIEATAEHGSVRLRADAFDSAGGLAEKTAAYEQAEAFSGEAFDLALGSGEDDVALSAATRLVFTVGYRMARHEEGQLWARVALGLHTRAGADADLAEASLRNSLGNVYRLQGRYQEAEHAHQRAVSICEQALGADHPKVANSHDNLGTVYKAQGRYPKAERALQKALSIRVQALGPDHPHVALSHNNLANVYKPQGRYEEAERAYHAAISILEQALGPDHPHVATSHSNLANLYRVQGRYEESARAHQEALSIFEQALGPDHPHVATSHSNLGSLYRMQGRYEDAVRSHQKALSLREQALGPDHPAVATSHNNLGSVYQSEGRYEEAERSHRKALSLREQALGTDHPAVATSQCNLGDAYQSQGRYEEAERAYQKALSIQEQALDPAHPHATYALLGLANARLELGSTDAAVRDAERAVELCNGQHVDVARLAGARFVLARALWQAGDDPTRARALAEQAREGYREAGDAEKDTLADVERWLATHGAEP